MFQGVVFCVVVFSCLLSWAGGVLALTVQLPY